MWPKFGNSNISVREVIITSILSGFDQKNHFSWGVVLVQIQYFETDTRYDFAILRQCGKRAKTKSQKVLWATSYVCRSYSQKTDMGPPSPSPPILNRVKLQLLFYHFIFYTQ